MITLIGTPPNIIIATFRQDVSREPFGMFDFAPVGITLALIGLFFITVIGWRLLPKRQTSESVQTLDKENFNDVPILDAEIALKQGRKTGDGRVDILAKYGGEYLGVIELNLHEINENTDIRVHLGLVDVFSVQELS